MLRQSSQHDRARADAYTPDAWYPNADLALQYDGLYWHKRTAARDTRRDAAFLRRHRRYLVVREAGLSITDPYQVATTCGQSPGNLAEVLEERLRLLGLEVDSLPTATVRAAWASAHQRCSP